MSEQAQALLHVPARDIPFPAHLSAIARNFLAPRGALPPYPPIEEKEEWRQYVSAIDQLVAPMVEQALVASVAQVEERDVGSAQVYDTLPSGVASRDRGVVLDMHGGGFIFCGGSICKSMGILTATRLQRRVWSVDYRMPPEHPYPSALDDCIAAYRGVLDVRSPSDIVVSGSSAGGNLAAALILRARQEGLPMPAGLILATPEADLTESGDSFHSNLGVDPALRTLMAVNLLYADGHDLTDPYLSPLFGDLTGFPPTLLTTGTRDLYLSNTVRMHRKLREANVPAELHVVEAGPHTGFPGSPEGEEIDREIRQFLTRVFRDCPG